MVILMEKYDVSFLKSYINLKNISYVKLSKKTEIPYYIISHLEQFTVTENQLKELLKVFKVSTYEELKELVSNDKKEYTENIDEDIIELYDITFLKSYLVSQKITMTTLSKKSNISTTVLIDRLNGKRKMNRTNLEKILKALNVSSYKELRNLAKTNGINTGKGYYHDNYFYDISFLKPYIELKGFTIKDIAKKLDVSFQGLGHSINGKKKISKRTLDKLLKLFNVSTYEELKELVSTDKTSSVMNLSDELIELKEENTIRDITFLKTYFKMTKEKMTDFTKNIDTTYANFNNAINGKYQANEQIISELLKSFNVDSLNELKEMVSLLKMRYSTEILLIKPNNELLKNNLYNRKIDNREVDLIKLLELLKKYNISKEEYNVVYLLFNYDNNFSINEISKITNIDIDKVLRIYSDCIQIYLETYYDAYEYDKKYLSKNKEG